jgi:hypothetical protein
MVHAFMVHSDCERPLRGTVEHDLVNLLVRTNDILDSQMRA